MLFIFGFNDSGVSTNLECIGGGKSSMAGNPDEGESFWKEAADLRKV